MKIGILGGGQLAMMLLQALPKIQKEFGLAELHTRILTENAFDPATSFANEVVLGSWKDPNSLEKFLGGLEKITIENEFIDCDIIEKSASTQSLFLPQLKTVRRLQDKLQQKHWLSILGIPSAHFETLDHENYEQQLVKLALQFPQGMVLKWSRLGYDGKGTFILDNKMDSSRLIPFMQEARKKEIKVFAEEKIDFVKELAITATYSQQKEFITYPVVETEQENGICRWVQGPATEFGLSAKLEKLAKSYAQKLAEAMPLHGTFAMEFFLTKNEEILVNEIAPRVHNSTHYSIDVTNVSQFENHMRTLLGLPLAKPIMSSPFWGMYNVLGTGRATDSLWKEKQIPNARTHWYDKSENKKGRKLGHVNFWAQTKDELRATRKSIESEAGETLG